MQNLNLLYNPHLPSLNKLCQVTLSTNSILEEEIKYEICQYFIKHLLFVLTIVFQKDIRYKFLNFAIYV